MSLLIKALEQAAKDRDSAKGISPLPAAAASSAEPTLEPPSARNARSAQSTAAFESAASAEPRAGRTPSETSALAHIDAQHQRARAAAVMEASESASGRMFSYVRGNPIVMFGAAAVVFGIGFGIYVYLQIAQPGFFVRPAQKAPDNAPLASAPNAQAATPAPSASAPAAPVNAIAATPAPDSSIPQINATAGGVAPASASPPPSSTGQSAKERERNPAPIPASAVIANAGSRDVPAESAFTAPSAAGEAVSRRERSSAQMPAGRQSTMRSTSAEAPCGRREQIAVSPTAAQPSVNPALTQAYAALQLGKLEEARGAYTKLSQAEPLNVDALLGLAFIAAQENRSDDATRLYLRILQINPRHAAAQGALIGLMGRADPIASETRLKQLIAREPSPFLHFVLGNLYADQGMWAQAQLAYYQAHRLEPDNPDYAYNLAVGLDHLRQNKLAVGFYRRAEQLATALGRANFDVSHARERIGILSSQLE